MINNKKSAYALFINNGGMGPAIKSSFYYIISMSQIKVSIQ